MAQLRRAAYACADSAPRLHDRPCLRCGGRTNVAVSRRASGRIGRCLRSPGASMYKDYNRARRGCRRVEVKLTLRLIALGRIVDIWYDRHWRSGACLCLSAASLAWIDDIIILPLVYKNPVHLRILQSPLRLYHHHAIHRLRYLQSESPQIRSGNVTDCAHC